MSNEPQDPQPKKISDMTGLGLVIGAGLGVLFGIFYHNIPIGITFGAALGLVLGAVFLLKNKK